MKLTTTMLPGVEPLQAGDLIQEGENVGVVFYFGGRYHILILDGPPHIALFHAEYIDTKIARRLGRVEEIDLKVREGS